MGELSSHLYPLDSGPNAAAILNPLLPTRLLFILFISFSSYFYSTPFHNVRHHVTWFAVVSASPSSSASPPNSNTGDARLIFSVLFSYFLFIFNRYRCTLPDFPSVSSKVSLPFLPRCHRTTTTSPLTVPYFLFSS